MCGVPLRSMLFTAVVQVMRRLSSAEQPDGTTTMRHVTACCLTLSPSYSFSTATTSFRAQLQGARGDSIGLNVAMTLSFLLIAQVMRRLND